MTKILQMLQKMLAVDLAVYKAGYNEFLTSKVLRNNLGFKSNVIHDPERQTIAVPLNNIATFVLQDLVNPRRKIQGLGHDK